MNAKREVCIVGHRNPDTDSICSAIAYAELKNRESGPNRYMAVRAGQLNEETLYVLKRFGVKQPGYLNNIGTRVQDMEIRKLKGVKPSISLKRAYEIMVSENAVTLPITSEANELEGVITINDIATSYMEKQDNTILSESRTPYRNILETLDAVMLVGDENAIFEKGKVLIAAAAADVMESFIEEKDLVILGNRYEMQFSAIESGAGCIVVCHNANVPKSLQRLASERNCTIIVTPLDSYMVARLINQSMPISYFMKSQNLVTFNVTDYTDEISEVMKSTRHRDFPILDKKGRYMGMISRRNLLGVKKRAVILVDHNETSQAVDNIRDAEILEIIDHHRLGSLETMSPVYFRNEPVGCTATIIYSICKEKGYEIPKTIAGLLCSAIISDTLLFRSPTCTFLDKAAAEALADIAEIDCEAFAMEMFAAGSNLKNKSPEEIFYQDYKKFEFSDIVFGVSQISSMSADELSSIRTILYPYLQHACEEHGLDMMFCMLTNILQESTTLLCVGEKVHEFIADVFQKEIVDGAIEIPGFVSRKKQLIPAFLDGISKEE